MTVEEMVERYAAGAALEDVAIVANTSAATIKDRLLKAGVTLRKRGGRPGKANTYSIFRKK